MLTLRENRVLVGSMIEKYCKDKHGNKGVLCDDCKVLQEYADARLMACPWGEDKPTCIKCPIHCYRPDMREKIRRVMRHSGPKMLFIKPWLTIKYLLKRAKKAPSLESLKEKKRERKGTGGTA